MNPSMPSVGCSLCIYLRGFGCLISIRRGGHIITSAH